MRELAATRHFSLVPDLCAHPADISNQISDISNQSSPVSNRPFRRFSSLPDPWSLIPDIPILKQGC
jgi:hypothetical protein